MKNIIYKSSFILGFQFLAFWPVVRWYILRTVDGSDEPWGVIALGTAAIFLAFRGKSSELSRFQVGVATLFTLLYVLSLFIAPPIVRAMLAVLAIGPTVSAHTKSSSLHFGVIALLLLSLPLIASLQFYLGYPIRLVTTHLAAALICCTGFTVVPSGTSLNWLGEVVSVDAPCSGIRMLWTGLYLNFTLASFSSLGPLATWLSYTLSMLTIFCGNLLRTTLLFFLEAHIFSMPKWGHEFIGISVFLLVALAIIRWNRVIVGYLAK